MGSIPRFSAHPIGSLLSGPVEPRGAYTNSPWLQNPLRFRQNPPRNMPERSFSSIIVFNFYMADALKVPRDSLEIITPQEYASEFDEGEE